MTEPNPPEPNPPEPNPPEQNPFRTVHRARRRRSLALGLTGALGAMGLAAAVWIVPAAVAAPPPVAAPVTAAPADPSADAPAAAPPQNDSPPASDPAALPTSPAVAAPPAPAAPAPQPPAAAPVAPAVPSVPTAANHAIDIDTAGYQRELDACLWVRMDLEGSVAPIVGAHNTCGGDVVLDMRLGDVVTLAGEGLDGAYVVTADRDARKGQDAAEATAGLEAAVLLQTCHWEGDGVRLVALLPLG